MKSFDYDIIIIGGGIHGAGVAQAAAAHGYSALVIEQQSLAHGTSSRSSKLIHGGLRYLESGQISLVRECLHERALLLKNAPELVKLSPFYIPVYPATTRRPWQLTTGLAMYSLLSGFDQSGRFKKLSTKKWAALDGLNTQSLQAVFQYYDAQTDDTLLTRAVMHSALTMSAELTMPATLESAQLIADGCEVNFKHNQKSVTKTCRVMVNAAGPWANQIADKITPVQTRVEVDLVQGSHIIINSELTQGCYYMEAPDDQRAVFAMPWYGKTMIGTTETLYKGEPEKVQPLETEKNYLLSVFRHYFPDFIDNRTSPIESAFAGLRVLPKAKTKAFNRPRETIYHCDRKNKPRILTIYGGKLTAYRATAEKVIHRLKSTLPDRKIIADTRKLPLSPAD